MSINKLKLGQRVYCIINGKIVTGNITKIMDKGININFMYAITNVLILKQYAIIVMYN